MYVTVGKIKSSYAKYTHVPLRTRMTKTFQ